MTRPAGGGGRDALAEAAATASSPAPPVVALGKFDALHRGHAALASGAASLGGSPWLISFSGMAAVLGWAPRAPLVAPADRARVLAGWASPTTPPPRERTIPFAAVRSLSPADFVALLAHDLGAAGVVVGEGYRFGHRAAGDTAALEELGSAAGLTVAVLPLVPQGGGGQASTSAAVSSSAVREALAVGDTAAVAALLGRRHRVVAEVGGGGGSGGGGGGLSLLLPFASLTNEAPGVGVYRGVGVTLLGGAGAADSTSAVSTATVEVLPGGGGLVVVLDSQGVGPGWPVLSSTALVALDF